MKISIISGIAALAAITTASPVPGDDHPSTAHITFIGAADAEYTQDFKTDGSSQKITNPLSVSKISSPKGVSCTFHGVDGSVTHLEGWRWSTVDVGPPQTQVSGTCHHI